MSTSSIDGSIRNYKGHLDTNTTMNSKDSVESSGHLFHRKPSKSWSVKNSDLSVKEVPSNQTRFSSIQEQFKRSVHSFYDIYSLLPEGSISKPLRNASISIIAGALFEYYYNTNVACHFTGFLCDRVWTWSYFLGS